MEWWTIHNLGYFILKSWKMVGYLVVGSCHGYQLGWFLFWLDWRKMENVNLSPIFSSLKVIFPWLYGQYGRGWNKIFEETIGNIKNGKFKIGNWNEIGKRVCLLLCGLLFSWCSSIVFKIWKQDIWRSVIDDCTW